MTGRNRRNTSEKDKGHRELGNQIARQRPQTRRPLQVENTLERRMRRTYSGMVPPRGTGRTDQNLQCASLGAEQPYVWKKKTFRPNTAPLLIYECHIGMAQDAEKSGLTMSSVKTCCPASLPMGTTAYKSWPYRNILTTEVSAIMYRVSLQLPAFRYAGGTETTHRRGT